MAIDGTELHGYKLKGHFKDGKGFTSNAFAGENLIKVLAG